MSKYELFDFKIQLLEKAGRLCSDQFRPVWQAKVEELKKKFLMMDVESLSQVA